MTEWSSIFVVVLQGAPEDAEELELVDLALELGHFTRKPVVVDLYDVGFFTAELLCALLRPARQGWDLPWLVGPLSATTRHRLEITGTVGAFSVFDSLPEAEIYARNL
ncbi:hypothetical protein G3I40_42825 [Streptomyces sp. SID14478]|uniref:hypothetical protein n=1 Tax=Streptomyces sp. SID14478 TaxID=2706073 RepID=UPI0013DF2550|nr:hypothetical protein [Streptomyces sp. SID14478]NEB81903.1 hypothetical protein [Streptomyces sp. SID14478]